MKIRLKHLLILFALGAFTFACESEDEDLTPPGNGNTEEVDDDDDNDDDDDGDTTSCPDQPVFSDSQHESFFTTIGASCIETSTYGQYIGSAGMSESPVHPDCMIEDVHFFKIHFGHADAEELSNSFDVDIFLLTEQEPQIGDNIDLGSNEVNAYFSTLVDGSSVVYKTSSGSLTLESTSVGVDMEGSFSMTGETFEAESNLDSFLLGEGSTPQDAETIDVNGNFYLKYHGLACGE